MLSTKEPFDAGCRCCTVPGTMRPRFERTRNSPTGSIANLARHPLQPRAPSPTRAEPRPPLLRRGCSSGSNRSSFSRSLRPTRSRRRQPRSREPRDRGGIGGGWWQPRPRSCCWLPVRRVPFVAHRTDPRHGSGPLRAVDPHAVLAYTATLGESADANTLDQRVAEKAAE